MLPNHTLRVKRIKKEEKKNDKKQKEKTTTIGLNHHFDQGK